ncbi:hypothetical protein LR48_Vigan11g034600 [Vigna angularis]|uniref:Uncharacterized protein n=1 Tax=Phaseolus angularis TaxID=3914 RepID=A0A0L9VQT4_PHAAN|nr:hypothetical protein LR48_Vigan11g034600 [Vigna angularis]
MPHLKLSLRSSRAPLLHRFCSSFCLLPGVGVLVGCCSRVSSSHTSHVHQAFWHPAIIFITYERRRSTTSARRRRVEEYCMDVIDEHDYEEQKEFIQHGHGEDDYVEQEDVQQQDDSSEEEHEAEGEDEMKMVNSQEVHMTPPYLPTIPSMLHLPYGKAGGKYGMLDKLKRELENGKDKAPARGKDLSTVQIHGCRYCRSMVIGSSTIVVPGVVVANLSMV